MQPLKKRVPSISPVTGSSSIDPVGSPVTPPTPTGMDGLAKVGAEWRAKGKGYNTIYRNAIDQWLAPDASADIAQTTYTTPKVTPMAKLTNEAVQPTQAPPTDPWLSASASKEIVNVWPVMEWPIVTPPTETTDTNKDLIIWVPELGWAEKTVYDQLSEAEKAQFQAIGETARKAGQDYVKAQALYIQKWKENKDYLTAQNQTNEEMRNKKDQVDEIQSSARIRQAQQQLNNLKQNLAYIWTGGQPGVSQARLNAVTDQVATADRTFTDMQTVEKLIGDSNKLGRTSESAQFERQMVILQDDLNSKVNQSIQDVLNQFNAAEIAGKIDTLQEVEALRVQLLGNLDKQITGVTDANIQQRAFLIERYDAIAKQKEERFKNKNTVNADLSKAQGYYVDGNGDPIISAKTGTRISVPLEAPIKPMYDEKTGRLVTFTTWPDGSIVAKVDDLIKDATFTESSIASFAKLVANGTLKMEDVPENVRNTDAFIQAASKAPGQKADEPKIYMMNDEDGVEHAYIYDAARGWLVPAGTSPTVSSWVPQSWVTPTSTKQTNPGDFIKSQEGFSDIAYWDVNGWAVWYGMHSIGGKPVVEGQKITREQADAEFNGRSFRYESIIEVPLSESQRAALASFEWNHGGGIWKGDAKPIIDKINAGDFAWAAEYMKQFVYSGGKKNDVLIQRRIKEAWLLSQLVQPGQSNQFTQVAQELIDGTVKTSDLKNLGYKDSQVRSIEAERQRLTKDQVLKTPVDTPAMLPLFRTFVEDGKIPSAPQLKAFGMTADQFVDLADQGYVKFLDQKAKDVSSQNPTFDISFIPSQYSANSATQKEKLNSSLEKVWDFDKRLSRLMELFDDVGTEILPTEAKKEMTTLRQQLILKWKEIENLWVLNGPDLGILETLLPATDTFWSLNSNTRKVFESLQTNYRSDAESRAINYGAKLKFGKKDSSITAPSGKTYNINDF